MGRPPISFIAGAAALAGAVLGLLAAEAALRSIAPDLAPAVRARLTGLGVPAPRLMRGDVNPAAFFDLTPAADPLPAAVRARARTDVTWTTEPADLVPHECAAPPARPLPAPMHLHYDANGQRNETVPERVDVLVFGDSNVGANAAYEPLCPRLARLLGASAYCVGVPMDFAPDHMRAAAAFIRRMKPKVFVYAFTETNTLMMTEYSVRWVRLPGDAPIALAETLVPVTPALVAAGALEVIDGIAAALRTALPMQGARTGLAWLYEAQMAVDGAPPAGFRVPPTLPIGAGGAPLVACEHRHRIGAAGLARADIERARAFRVLVRLVHGVAAAARAEGAVPAVALFRAKGSVLAERALAAGDREAERLFAAYPRLVVTPEGRIDEIDGPLPVADARAHLDDQRAAFAAAFADLPFVDDTDALRAVVAAGDEPFWPYDSHRNDRGLAASVAVFAERIRPLLPP